MSNRNSRHNCIFVGCRRGPERGTPLVDALERCSGELPLPERPKLGSVKLCRAGGGRPESRAPRSLRRGQESSKTAAQPHSCPSRLLLAAAEGLPAPLDLGSGPGRWWWRDGSEGWSLMGSVVHLESCGFPGPATATQGAGGFTHESPVGGLCITLSHSSAYLQFWPGPEPQCSSQLLGLISAS